MPTVSTEHACQTAAEQAAHCLQPACAALTPRGRPAESLQADAMPVVLRNYLGVGVRAPEPVMQAPVADASTGAAVLRLCIDGLCAEMAGSLASWHASLGRSLPELLHEATPSANYWELVADLQYGAHEVLTALTRLGRDGSPGPRMLTERLALLEDLLAGTLRRSAVPAETAAVCATGLTDAVASLFGLAPSGGGER
jgi:hypothetical protein